MKRLLGKRSTCRRTPLLHPLRQAGGGELQQQELLAESGEMQGGLPTPAAAANKLCVPGEIANPLWASAGFLTGVWFDGYRNLGSQSLQYQGQHQRKKSHKDAVCLFTDHMELEKSPYPPLADSLGHLTDDVKIHGKVGIREAQVSGGTGRVH